VYETLQFITEKYLCFSYLLRKKEFLDLAENVFLLEPTEDGKRLYKLFKVKNS